jgi:hypothetical protein
MKLSTTTTALFLALGQAERLTRAATLGAHKEYTKSTPEQQAQLMHDCLVQYIIGYTECSQKAAERILSQSRDDRTKQAQEAYYKGYSKFRYHIIRPNDEPESSGRQVKVTAPRKVFKAVLSEVLDSGITKAEFDALITELRAAITFA